MHQYLFFNLDKVNFSKDTLNKFISSLNGTGFAIKIQKSILTSLKIL